MTAHLRVTGPCIFGELSTTEYLFQSYVEAQDFLGQGVHTFDLPLYKAEIDGEDVTTLIPEPATEWEWEQFVEVGTEFEVFDYGVVPASPSDSLDNTVPEELGGEG